MHIRLIGGLELPLDGYEQCVSCLGLVTSLVTAWPSGCWDRPHNPPSVILIRKPGG